MTFAEASALASQHNATVTEEGGRFVVRRFGQLLSNGASVAAALHAAALPVLVRSEDEALELAEAVLGPDAGVFEEDGEFLIGRIILFDQYSNSSAGGLVSPSTPAHGLREIVAEGRSWADAFGRLGAQVVDAAPSAGA